MKKQLLDFLKYKIRPFLIPLIRSYIRYIPFNLGKTLYWRLLVRPLVEWAPHQFEASTFFGGKMNGNTRDTIQRYIYYFGSWEPALTAWIGRNLHIGDVFVDVGANIGYFSLYASTLVGNSGRVIAIEASPSIFVMLQKNIALNNLNNIRAVNVAASDRSGILTIYRAPNDNVGSTTTLVTKGFSTECDIQAQPLDIILELDEITRARLVKIDVEGAEWQVVQGLKRLLEIGRSDLEVITEISPARLVAQGRSPTDIVDLFSRYGFHAYYLETDYSPFIYMSSKKECRPKRLREPIQEMTDVVFSRRSADFL